MKVAIHQPQYFPWSPYVHKAMAADIFVYLDTVQFSKNGVQNRNQIKTAQGAHWLTIPVQQRLGQKISDVAIADLKTTAKHWATIQANYSKTAGFQRWKAELQALFNNSFALLVELSIASTEWMLERLNVTSKRVRASELVGVEGEASKLVASICKTLKADSYLTGTGALAYLDEDDFSQVNCEIEVQTWSSFSYDQANRQVPFVPDLSALDLLLNCPDNAGDLIRTAGSWKPLSPR